MSENEQWRPIPGQPDYEASSAGNIRRYDRGEVIPFINDYGYWMVYMRDTQRQRLVHRLVLAAFRGPCPAGMEGCHNDGNRGNNRLSNLRWDTRTGNANDSRQQGTMVRGEMMPTSKLTEEDVTDIIKSLKRGETIRSIARRHSVWPQTIFAIKTGGRWGHRHSAFGDAKMRARTKLSREQVLGIVADKKNGASRQELASKYGVTATMISNIVLGRSRGDITGIVFKRSYAYRIVTEEQASDIAAALRGGDVGVALARKYGVSHTVICAIKASIPRPERRAS